MSNSRILIIASFLAVIAAIQIRSRFRDTASDKTVELVAGDLITDLKVARLPAQDSGSFPLETRLSQIEPSRCLIAIFFLSTCDFCHQIADRWSRVASVAGRGSSAQVAWISVSPADTGAESFVHQYALKTPAFRLRDIRDRRRLGVTGVPTVYLLDEKMRFVAELPTTPAKIAVDTLFSCHASP